MQVTGILETALYVADPVASASFYRRLFSFPALLETERLIALDVAGRSVLLLFKRGATGGPFATPGGVIPAHAGSGITHFAFGIAAEDVDPWIQQLGTEGVAVISTVTWPGGARSVYFHDPDHNVVELISPGFWAIY
jgi:catechol 2,3-dioxygenase-like lactoylglutathione lyase family enzyme